MTPFQHKAISASAGSGKTFRLAHRYMGLLARGVPPDRICALTFSRKAAGEIFDAIVRYLAGASQSPERAKLSAQYMEAGRITAGQYRAILRSFVENLPAVNIGTIDGFIVGIIRVFPLELGLNGAEFDLMDNDSADAEFFREEVMAAVCNTKKIGKAGADIFLESLRQATLGMEKKSFADSLFGFLNDYRTAFINLPEENSWGNPGLIWEDPPWWLNPPAGTTPENAAETARIIDGLTGWHAAMKNSLLKLAENLTAFDAGSEWNADLFINGRIQSQLVENIINRKAVKLKIEYNRREYLLPDEIARAFRRFYHNLFYIHFSRLLKRTGGMFKVMAMYEREYEKALLQTGRLTFTDAQLILVPRGFASGGAVISRRQPPETAESAAGENRIFIDYRLDAKFDHWLIDEFQDTSNLQWQVLQNLADEILQDDTGTRSFFYVGDVKQTIYRWRGGNPELFAGVLKRYGKKIVNEPLNETQRSAPPVMETVNIVFSRLPETWGVKSEPAIPSAARANWSAAWQKHKCGKQAPADGYTALIRPAPPQNAEYHEETEQFELLAALLEHINPPARGLSAAILVRKNKTGKTITDFLRQRCPGLNISYEGETVLLDSPLVTVILDLFRYAEHPADNFARQHLLMSPLGGWLNKNKLSPEELPFMLLGKIQNEGFKPAIRFWADKIGALNDFGRLRLEQMLEIAGQFDSRCDRNIGLFIKTVESYGLREASDAKGCVHIMTIHSSKGLGFDLVILPDLNAGEKMNSAGAIDFLTGSARGPDSPGWILTMPDRKTAACDPVLKQSLDEADNLAALDNLCLLYVAMTRAKKALYLLTRTQKRKCFNMAAFLEEQLPANTPPRNIIIGSGPRRTPAELLYEIGSPRWFEKEKPGQFPTPETPERKKNATPGKARRAFLEKTEPSLEEKIPLNAAWLFKDESAEVLHFGSAIHELFRRVEWSDNARPDEIIRAWQPAPSCPDKVIRDVKKQFLRAMAGTEIRAALAQPAGPAELWREKSFDVILAGKWVSGIFDRVVIRRADSGAPISAKIIDYKSNRATAPEKISEISLGYKPQIALYRRALASLLNLRESDIEACLLFTVSGKIVTG
ncbi:MAG: UvrD-helicase domain-containing protein [Kiritimatiellae bacterium]|nr:UvrD-helicase domain-containing protein [Kiritimatiellia bacterium]